MDKEQNNSKKQQKQQLENKVIDKQSIQDKAHTFQSINLSVKNQQFVLNNLRQYPYSRAHHYFFMIENFPRVTLHQRFNNQKQADGSPSYALDAHNKFGFTYPHDNQQIKGTKINQILNRQLFGCPMNDGVRSAPTKDKNPSQSYLFNLQDNKYQIQRYLYLYRRVLKNLQHLKKQKKLAHFEAIANDLVLQQIIDENLSIQNCRIMLQLRIKSLEERKLEKSPIWIRQDSLFFKPSLNQFLHNEIEQASQRLAVSQILGGIIHQDTIRGKLLKNRNNKYGQKQLCQLFEYFDATQICVTQQCLNKFSQSASQEFIRRLQNGHFKIDFPICFLCLSNTRILQLTQKLISCKLCNAGDSYFYVFKAFWKKITGRQIQMIKTNYEGNYLNLIQQLSQKLRDFTSQKQEINKISYPKLDNLVSLGQLQGKIADYIFPRNGQSAITSRQLIIIVYIYYLYDGLLEIQKFIDMNSLLVGIIGSPSYAKYQQAFVDSANSVKFGLIYQILERLTQFILRQELTEDFNFTFVYNKEQSIAYVYRSSQECEWESDNQEQLIEEDDGDGDDNDEQVQDKVMKKPKYQ